MYVLAMASLLKEAFAAWNRDKAARLGAAIAYYTMVSLAPLLIIAVAIGGAVFGEQAARGEIVGQIGTLIGEDSARGIQSIIEHAREQPKQGWFAGVLGIGILLVGAAGVFIQLQDALNTIWRVQPKLDSAFKEVVQKYLLSFTMVIGIGFLLLVSLIISAALSALTKYVGSLLPGYLVVGELLNQLLSLGIITLLFALMFKFLPDVELKWRDVWMAAGLTSLLFAIGKFFIGFYLGHSIIASAYGAAGSLVVILIWVYYTTQIFLFGVEFTKCYKRRRGSPIVPEPHAERYERKVRQPVERRTA